jgi:hypothetical protein
MGDGAIYDRGKSKRLVIALAESDQDLLIAMAERLGDPSLVQNAPAQSEREQPKAVLRIDHTGFVNDLHTAGIPFSPKSGREQFLNLATPRLTWNFIRGVFDADGNIRVYLRYSTVKGTSYGPYSKARLTITCGQPLLIGLRGFLETEGLSLSPKCIKPKGMTGVLEIANPGTILRMSERMYEYGALWLPRKRVVFEQL